MEAKPTFKAQGTSVLLLNADGEHGNTLQVADCTFPADAEFIVRACNAHGDLVAALKQAMEEAIFPSKQLSDVWTKCEAALAKAGSES
jgi:hypothetical protein